jgi:hypothetical protein
VADKPNKQILEDFTPKCPICLKDDELFLRGKGMKKGKLLECLRCKKTFEVHA